MSQEVTEDELVFGEDRWVYCAAHRRPHMTGWCTVPASDKILLDARNEVMAELECFEKGYLIRNPAVDPND